MTPTTRRTAFALAAILAGTTTTLAAGTDYWFRFGRSFGPMAAGGGATPGGPGTGTGDPGGTDPDGGTDPTAASLAFVPAASVADQPVDSAPAIYSGPAGAAPMAATGGLLRVCADQTCAQPFGGFSSSTTAEPGRYVQARFVDTRDGAGGTVHVTTAVPDGSFIVAKFVVAPVSAVSKLGGFPALVDVEPGVSVRSADSVYAGPDATLSLAGDGSAYHVVCRNDVCGQPSVAPVQVVNGDVVRLGMTSGPFSQARTTTLSAGTASTSWSVSTKADPSPPSALSLVFYEAEAVAGQPVDSWPSAFSGPADPTRLTATGGTIRVCDDEECVGEPDAFSATADVVPGMFVQARFVGTGDGGHVDVAMSTDADPVVTSFVVRKGDDGTGNGPIVLETAFGDFVDVAGSAPSVPHVSNEPVYSGPTATLTLGGEPSARFAVCRSGVCGPQRMGTAELKTGDAVRLSMRSGPGDESRTATVSLDNTNSGIDRTWRISTTGRDDTPDPLSFYRTFDQSPDVDLQYGRDFEAKGFEVPVRMTVVDGEVSVDGGPWTKDVVVAPGARLDFRTRTAFEGVRTMAVTFGKLTPATWIVETRPEYATFRHEKEGVEPGSTHLSPEFVVDGLLVPNQAILEFEAGTLVSGLEMVDSTHAIVRPGDRFRLKVISDDRFGVYTERSAVIRQEKVLFSFQTHVRDADLVPDAFGIPPESMPFLYYGNSQWIELTGFEGPIPIELDPDEDGDVALQVWPSYRKDEPTYNNDLYLRRVNVAPGDRFRVRGQSNIDRSIFYVKVTAGYPGGTVEAVWNVSFGMPTNPH